MDRVKNQKALKKLFEIKKHREDRLSRELAKNQIALQNCDEAIARLEAEQLTLIPKWQSANQIPFNADPYALNLELKKHYTLFFSKSEEIFGAIRQQRKEKEELLQKREVLHQALNKNRVDQEKVKYMAENMK